MEGFKNQYLAWTRIWDCLRKQRTILKLKSHTQQSNGVIQSIDTVLLPKM